MQFPVIYQLSFFGILMSFVALSGALVYLIKRETLQKFLSYFVAAASGTLLGGAFFHMIPHALEAKGPVLSLGVVLCGFVVLYALELFVHWHHCSSEQQGRARPEGVMILIADGLHNFIGGLGVGAGFIADPALGFSMWVMALLHEIPQEIGDFAILLHSGWSKKKALIFNFLSALTFPLAMLFVYVLNTRIDVSLLIPFAAGNFIYIAASDLIPEVKRHEKLSVAFGHLMAFILGVVILLAAEIYQPHH